MRWLVWKVRGSNQGGVDVALNSNQGGDHVASNSGLVRVGADTGAGVGRADSLVCAGVDDNGEPMIADNEVRPKGFTGRPSTLTAGQVREIRRVHGQLKAARLEWDQLKAKYGAAIVSRASRPELHKWVR